MVCDVESDVVMRCSDAVCNVEFDIVMRCGDAVCDVESDVVMRCSDADVTEVTRRSSREWGSGRGIKWAGDVFAESDGAEQGW